MTTRRTDVVVLACALFSVALLLLPGCAAKKAAAPGETALTLEYRLPKGTPVTYSNTQTSTQTMEMMGQSMNVQTDRAMVFTLMPGEIKNNKQQMTVTIDSMQAQVTAPQGSFTADVSPVIGKSFEMSLSMTGKELDLSGADLLQYSIGQAGQRTVKPDFQSMFPDLSGTPVKVGDTWTIRDTTYVNESGLALTIMTESLDTLEGFETVGGVECARIRGVITGTATGAGEQQGTQIAIDSKMNGTEVWLFAYKAGRLTKFDSDVSMDGTITLGGPQGMNMPMKQAMKTETVFVK